MFDDKTSYIKCQDCLAEFQPGFGFGAAKFRIVFIFETLDAFNGFVTSGWEAGANAMASAKTMDEGRALERNPVQLWITG